MDSGTIMIATVALGWAITRIVQSLKLIGLTGTRPIIGAVFGIGVLFAGLWGAAERGIIPEGAQTWIDIAVIALAGGLTAIGEYEFIMAKDKQA